MSSVHKRLICCCDGTWMDSDDGFNKPTLIPYQPNATVQVPSNVTRISRALMRVAEDGVHQIIFYHAGVGTSPGMLDAITGGATGRGISENIREVYSFIVTNYTPGDEIILIGFSRGAFTVRSVAGMIDNIGLLTLTGMESFYPIFKDQENFSTPSYTDLFPDVPFPRKPTGPGKGREYKRRLEKLNLTRVYDPDDSKICVKAVAVWDTVGALGIPSISLVSRLGMAHSAKEYKFYNTNLSGIIKHAFQALALDERRRPFSPAVWERKSASRDTTTDLRQVWFPGAHSNVGGGYDDQELANVSLAWMMDQLASIGVSFIDDAINLAFEQNSEYYLKGGSNSSKRSSRKEKQWAITPIYEKHRPIRPWALGKVYDSSSGIYTLAGKQWRTPGLYFCADPDTGAPTNTPMENTNERIHSSVRIRLELEGLGLDDNGLYEANALPSKLWRLRHVRMKADDPIPYDASWGPGTPASEKTPDNERWIWEYCGPEDTAPKKRFMVEENLGPYERRLLLLNKGKSPPKRRKKRRKPPTGISTSTRITSDTSQLNTPTPLPYREKSQYREKIIIHEGELDSPPPRQVYEARQSYIDPDDDPRGPPPPFREKIPRTPPPFLPPSPPPFSHSSPPPIVVGRTSRVRYESMERDRRPEVVSPVSSKGRRYERVERDRPMEVVSPVSSIGGNGRRYREFDASDREEQEGGRNGERRRGSVYGDAREKRQSVDGRQRGGDEREEYRDWERQPTARQREYERERRASVRY